MCGIAGILRPPGRDDACALSEAAARMAGTLDHRGPDDGGTWSDPVAGVALGFRRLAIVDLSPLGHQPMESDSGRYVIVFNGEIYNFGDLRKKLEREGGGGFRGRSDTEVLLRAVERWGLGVALERCIGMFAFALWDRKQRLLHLVRDRVGEKPLYFGRAGGTFLFGSELKALRAYAGFDAEIDRDVLGVYMRRGYIPAPYSIYKNINKLTPGTVLTVDARDLNADREPVAYWSAARAVEAGAADPFRGGDGEAAEALDQLLRDAVGKQMVADVPLGAFLSGGIDSSTVVALMQSQSPKPVKTFTSGFDEEGFDEAAHARAVAGHLGTQHTELYLRPAEAMALVPLIPSLFDEPYADSSQIPTYLLSQLARQSVTVSLSGDGGDELFGGYSWYSRARSLWGTGRWIPGPIRRLTGNAIAGLTPEHCDRILYAIRPFLPGRLRKGASGDRLGKLAEILANMDGPESVHWQLAAKWSRPSSVVLDSSESGPSASAAVMGPPRGGHMSRLMYLDFVNYLPDDILAKVDRTSMAVSLESRAPLLDHRVVEFAWRIPEAMKLRDGRGKWLLRQVLYKYVPPALVDRPKMGFCVPIDTWLRGPLRDWAEDLLHPDRLRAEGFFDPAPIRRTWEEHLSGRRNWQGQLWCVLMFQAWLDDCKYAAPVTRPTAIPTGANTP
jgi:asparagine synthase (glutamine-hydrolysing)